MCAEVLKRGSLAAARAPFAPAQTTSRHRREFLAFHWHPQSRVSWPHLHVRAGVEPALATAHIPTGRVPLEDIVRMLIDDLGARPLRDDWRDVLALTRATFEQERTW